MPLLLLAIVTCGCGNGGASSGVAMAFVWLLLVFSFLLPFFSSFFFTFFRSSLSLSFSLSITFLSRCCCQGYCLIVLLYTIQHKFLACTSRNDSISKSVSCVHGRVSSTIYAQGSLKRGVGRGIFPLGRCLPPFENQ